MSDIQIAQTASKRTQTRLAICRTCSLYDCQGRKCALHEGCCFGKALADPVYRCPEGKW